MKARSSTPVHVHAEDSTAVHVHVQRSQSLPSSAERVLPKSNITASSVIRSSDRVAAPATQKAELGPKRPGGGCMHAERDRAVSFEESSSDVPAGSGTSAEELAQGSSRPDGAGGTYCGQWERDRERARSDHEELTPDSSQLLLTALQDAEKAANSAAIQLVSFKELLGDRSADSRLNASEERWMSRQKALLLEKLEAFKSMNRAVRLQLKDFQDREADRLEADRHMYVLLKKLTLTETENLNLKKDLSEKERRIEELINIKQKEKEKLETVMQLSKSVETTRAHLQGQLRNKESENSRLTVQLRGLEKTIAEQKLQIESLKTQISSVSEKEKEEKEALKKATRVQKQRAEKFETAMEKSYALLREKDAELASVRAEVEVWRRRQEEVVEVKTPLEAQVAVLKQQISEMTELLQSERANVRMSNEDLLQKVEKLNSENADVSLENAALKASVSDLEEKLRRCVEEMQEQASISQHQKQLREDYQTQVADQQKEVEELKTRLEKVLKEKEELMEAKDAEVRKVREQLQVRVSELEAYPELLSAAEQRVRDCQDRLGLSQETLSLEAHTLQQLQAKMENQTEQLRSSLDMKDSIREANTDLQGKIESLQRRVEEVAAENRDLVQKLSVQEEALQYSGRQLELRSAECLSLTRQLETALADVKQQVSIVTEKAAARERTLQSKILELDSERNRSEKELKALRLSKESMEKQFEVRQKDLQLRLDQSETHKRSIQNYIDFLKNSYTAMFEDSLSPDLGFSSSFK
ncbi:outer dense fiber protein 2-like [Anguilla anguilla]|uniref:outer dense fiber protein 2-like n=1 Tax=Anguilla anguilla TaxID=7936 RepID=UPI0015A863E9|nr:outer dense fiber protein 2-like [Anguilla anguilla]XP_035276282.1 outer dense fiber protein 2-like [Anguilla anguilla]XP_035276283.1 outer dense fiber protein 2-like [Anguilla anguilla]XP_035276284.1 outer dense fiber protein 2-like [Anguilla anguilla]